MKKDIKITAFYDNCNYDIPETLKEFMQFWQDKINLIPTEFIDTAKIVVEAEECYDVICLNVDVSYKRPETNQEEEKRIAQEEENRIWTRKKDLKKLEELKNKYPEY